MRPTRMVAGATLTAALALVALPGIAGSRSPSPESIVEPAAFQSLRVPANAMGRQLVVDPIDPALAAAGQADATTQFIEPGAAPTRVLTRPLVRQPAAHGGSSLKPPRYKLTGTATFYGNGTTAMRLPRGTTIIVCGAGGCLERIVTDYGPTAAGGRLIDLYTPDFFKICGCPSWSGTTKVTVSVY